ncbi:MAG: DNA adenine methylase [Anaerolineae bacterium]|nr:DNA adenine methylase [Anaerolineae bacterium]
MRRLKQRADYTHQFNRRAGRHGWLRLTPAYSVKIVEEIVQTWDKPMRVYDPFCGTGTTALSSAYHGHTAITTDINPFLVWFGRVKTARYSDQRITETLHAAQAARKMVAHGQIAPVAPPPIHQIERWWSVDTLNFLCGLRAALDVVAEAGSPVWDLLRVAFCRTLIAHSNAAFNHQSMSFKNAEQLSLGLSHDLGEMFVQDVRFVLEGAADNPSGDATVLLADARDPEMPQDARFEQIVTSPPYANRMSYIRELRPYMYWLGFLESGREAGELDWNSIGGTWGIATSRLNEWRRRTDTFTHPLLDDALEKIAQGDNKNGALLANYVARYHDDMWMHFQHVRRLLEPSAALHYVVGNSTFYGVLLPVEQIYAAMLEAQGFESVICTPIRKRNSNKSLVEFIVSAKWGG